MLLEIAEIPASKQKKHLEKIFNNWKGNLDQVDDVTVLGTRF
jgi:hypothetical protein